jgi:hypothetical protein
VITGLRWFINLYILVLSLSIQNKEWQEIGSEFNQLLEFICVPEQLSRFSDSVGAEWSGDHIPVRERFSTPVQASPGAHLAPVQWVLGLFPGRKVAGMWLYHQPISNTEIKERVELLYAFYWVIPGVLNLYCEI